MTDPGESFSTFEALARSRRSVRAFEPDAVPDDVLERCLSLALAAPNSHNLQPWQFVCVRDPGVQRELRRDCLSTRRPRLRGLHSER
ncbi:MAG: nitroreductase family protein [Myxococcota bacterium]